MSRLRLLLLLVLLGVVAVVAWAWWRNTRPPLVAFAKVARERLVSTLVTNGKAEPYRWAPVRAVRAGLIETVAVERGQRLAAGATIATLDTRDVRAEVSEAEAAVAQARAELDRLARGGPTSARTEVENALAQARADLANAQRDLATLRRLEQHQAATRQQVTDARRQVDRLQAEIAALESKRAALVDPQDRTAAEARLKEAQARLEQARGRLESSRLTAPIAGVVYDLAARPGAFVNAGDLVAAVGQLDRLRVRVYVDEPELGRVREGMPVVITWDALPGRSWKGDVETTPTQVVALGTRQVGEVICTIENPGLELLPGTNVNAEIQTQVAESALTIPKEAVRRNAGNELGVLVLRGGRVEWRRVQLGASSVTRTAVTSGLSEGEMVALSADVHSGDRVARNESDAR